MRRNLKHVTILSEEEPGRVGPVELELLQDVDGLGTIRQLAGKGQADVAAVLNIKQPSVSQIEK